MPTFTAQTAITAVNQVPDVTFIRPEDLVDTHITTSSESIYVSPVCNAEIVGLTERIEELEKRLDYLQDLISDETWNVITGKTKGV